MNCWRDISGVPRRLRCREGQRQMENDSRNSVTLCIKRGKTTRGFDTSLQGLRRIHYHQSPQFFFFFKFKFNLKTEGARQHKHRQVCVCVWGGSRFWLSASETNFPPKKLVQKITNRLKNLKNLQFVAAGLN